MSGITRIVRFGDFSLDVRTGELDGPAGRERLQDLPLRVLTVLIDSAGDLVTRDQLRRHVWPGDTFVNFDNALWTAMKKLRRSLGDDAAKPQFLETLPKKGYRFIAEVETVRDSTDGHDDSSIIASIAHNGEITPAPSALVGQLQTENRRLRTLVAELSLECERLREDACRAQVPA